MITAANIFVGVLEDEIKCWKEAALRCESAIPSLSGARQRRYWMMTAASYRHRAKDLEIIIEEVNKLQSDKGSVPLTRLDQAATAK